MIGAILLTAILPFSELTIIKEVAQQYHLTKEEHTLLVAIRKIENGRPGLEFGVGDGNVNHPARRFTDGWKSFRVQAQWAAGTIKCRYHGNLEQFAKWYCPFNHKQWTRAVRQIMQKVTKERVCQ